MNRHVRTLLFVQFLTAFGDNALLFTAVALALHKGHGYAWYLPALQAAFLVAFVVLAPWAGPYADTRPKARVLTNANVLKAVGAAMMLAGVEPLFAYTIVGMGAAIYSPAKYGILPELVEARELIHVNGWIEGVTIVAILFGTVTGGKIADVSIRAALGGVLVLYCAAALAALFIRRTAASRTEGPPVLSNFKRMTAALLSSSKGRVAAVGVSLFWGAAAVLRVVLAAWAPLVLGLRDSTDIAFLMVYVAVGVAVGAVAAPRLIPVGHLRRTRLAAYMMGVCVILLSLVHTIEPTRGMLLLAGVFGGLFMVPMNATLQDIGYCSVGSGGAMAVQQFLENLAMVVGTLVYSLAALEGASPTSALMLLGASVVVVTFVVSLQLPPFVRPLPGPVEPAEEVES